MNNQIRSGVILTEVCGEYLLLATMDAGRHCPYVYQINETAAFFWRLLEKGLSEEEMVRQISAAYEAPGEAIRRDLRKFIKSMQEQGYLMQKEE